MKAQYIIENINFERGEDPRKTLGLERKFLEVNKVGRRELQSLYTDDSAKKILKSLSTENPILPIEDIKIFYNTDEYKTQLDTLDFVLTIDFMQDILGRKFDYLKYMGEYFPIDHLVDGYNIK